MALLLIFAMGCSRDPCLFEPAICYYPNQRVIERLPSAFAPLSEEELQTEWGKELFLGSQFAGELDLYRAITNFKSALFLISDQENPRADQIKFNLVEAYYLGGKYAEAVDLFESSGLKQISLQFPAFRELLIILYDCYIQTGRIDQAMRLLCLLDAETTEKLQVYQAVKEADFSTVQPSEALDAFQACACSLSKSPRKAQLLNAFLPGAGYYYVGEKKAALTSFLINTLFIAAAYQFFDRGYVAAGIITSSIEAGWYFGGINGAGLAAREWNERVYEAHGKEFLIQQRLFPILMFNYAF